MMITSIDYLTMTKKEFIEKHENLKKEAINARN